MMWAIQRNQIIFFDEVNKIRTLISWSSILHEQQRCVFKSIHRERERDRVALAGCCYRRFHQAAPMAMLRAGLLGRHLSHPLRLVCRQARSRASPRCFYPFPESSLLSSFVLRDVFKSPSDFFPSRYCSAGSILRRFFLSLFIRRSGLPSLYMLCFAFAFSSAVCFRLLIWPRFWVLSGWQMSTEPQAAISRIKESGLLRTQGLIGGKWTDANGGKTLPVHHTFF